ncbi:hypothetical protein HG531_005416 [Fusarium graminearum]|nr:hypothetical protein HG531_005416 [Fusarium graminearum]
MAVTLRQPHFSCLGSGLLLLSRHRGCCYRSLAAYNTSLLDTVLIDRVELSGARKLAAHSLGLVLAFDTELLTLNGSDDSIAKVDGELRLRVDTVVIRVLELVKRALDQSPGCGVVHVGELDGVNRTRRLVGVNETVATASVEGVPFKVRGDTLDDRKLVVVQGSRLVGLTASQLGESLHSLLNDLNNMGLKGVEVVLNSDQVISVVVLGNNLAVETVQDTTVHDVRIIVAVKVTTGRVERRRVLAEQLNLLLSGVTGLLYLLGSLFSTALEDGEDGAFDALFGLDVGVDKGLGVGAHVLKEASHAAEALVEVVTLL